MIRSGEAPNWGGDYCAPVGWPVGGIGGGGGGGGGSAKLARSLAGLHAKRLSKIAIGRGRLWFAEIASAKEH